MIHVIVLTTIVVFVVVDLTLRLVMKRIDRARLRKQRKAALDIGLKLQVAEEAPSLKRVAVNEPKARILAVDDEPVILDSFRKILVLDGYSVDTVETGGEALALVQENDYDFVFTDLKMASLDGLEVTKAVKHLRPDVDVVMITGFASVQSAVDAMKYGALDYVEKPFTEDELIEFTRKCLFRRQERLEQQRPAKVHLVTSRSPGTDSDRVFNVPAGLFISPAHVWVRIEMTGEVRAGLDDFARKSLGDIDEVVLPTPGRRIAKGQGLFTVRHQERSLTFPSPVSGVISRVHEDVSDHVDYLAINPYEIGWLCSVKPDDLAKDLESLRIGAGAVAWYEEEIERFRKLAGGGGDDEEGQASDAAPIAAPSGGSWEAFGRSFLGA